MRTRLWKLVIPALLIPALMTLAGGCRTEEAGSPAEGADLERGAPRAGEDAPAGISVLPVEVVGQGEVVLVPVDEPTRPRRRMDIGQLDAAIQRVSGGIAWTEPRSGKPVNLFTELSATLGVPNYVQTTREDLSPSVIFEKFLGDAARSVCDTLAERDLSVAAPERVLMSYVDPADTIDSAPEAVEENLRYLLLRYHGHSIEPGSTSINLWSWLFESVTLVSGDPVKGWRAVCVALITHPDFYSY